MVQIIEENRRPTTAEKFNRAINTGMQALSENTKAQQMQQQMAQENEAAKEMGINLSGIQNPKIRELILGERLKGQEQRSLQGQKLQGEQEVEGRDYEVVKNTFGDKFANLWRSQSPDARNALIRAGIESSQRGMNIEELLGGLNPDQQKTDETSDEEPIADLTQKQPVKTKDYDKGLLPAERTKRQEGRYKTNLPLFQQSAQKTQSYETLKDELGVLEELSPLIKGFERVNINPKTGELIIPALASPEAQRYVKTINDLTRSAKDTYGSRVTNFDLSQFLKRLPTLANSQESRTQILRQLGLINDMNLIHEKELQNVIEEHGGIRNIDYDVAETMAKKRSDNEISGLRKEFTSIGKNLDKLEEKNLKAFKAVVPKDRVAVRNADGTIGHIPKDKVKEYLRDQAGQIL